MATPTKMLEDEATSISHTVSSVTDLPIPTQKEARDSQDNPTPKTPPILRKPSRIKHRPQDDIEVQSLQQGEDLLTDSIRQQYGTADLQSLSHLSVQTQPHAVHLSGLPVEVQEGIIDHLAGQLIGIASATAATPRGPRNWSTAMRHPRRKQLSDLALVSKTWRNLIQERLYRHIKVKGTYSGMSECRHWFLKHPHLAPHVRHFEVWVPVWEVKTTRRATEIPPIPSAFSPRPDMRAARANGRAAIVVQEISDMTQAFQQASHNVTLEEIFEHLLEVFPAAYALTIEGGQGKRTALMKPRKYGRKIEQLGNPLSICYANSPLIPTNPKIGSLVLKGAWNIIREPQEFFFIKSAFPNLREYHCTYAKPKIQAYEATCRILKSFPSPITHLNLCLEGLTGKAPSHPEKWRSLYACYHICNDVSRILPDLETFTYTGRVCGNIFRNAIDFPSEIRDPRRLKSVDLIVRNCCRRNGAGHFNPNDATGIYQLDFIHAFKNLVVDAVRALAVFPGLKYLRIRFLDLDSPNPLLNPYFHLQGERVTGIWNEEILHLLKIARPRAEYECLDVGVSGVGRDLHGEGTGFMDTSLLGGLVPLPRGGRPKSMCVDAYGALAEARM